MKNTKFTLWQVLSFIIVAIMALVLALSPGGHKQSSSRQKAESSTERTSAVSSGPAAPQRFSYSDDVPAYSGRRSVPVHGNRPYFLKSDFTERSYESYHSLDRLGRCGPAMACLGKDLMPDGPRPRLSSIHPTGWHYDRYSFIEGELLYNRSHLIAYSLAGEGANERNLITGTREMNAEAMEPYEHETASYIRRTGNHVLYRVTPVFLGNDLLARGVLMEAESVEDHGRGIRFCVFCYNAEPRVQIDYATGDNRLVK